ncbi:MAG: AraC family transcriptional regulator [Clostridia bacterium]|nr:AraC family transcriptional regulator [Clostridia bacterium]
MIFSPDLFCACGEGLDETFSGELSLTGDGLWVGVVSSGRCTGGGAVLMASPGDFFAGRGPVALHAPVPSHLAAVSLSGSAAQAFPDSLRFFAGRSCPRGAELITQLLTDAQSPSRRSALAYSLLCDLSEAQVPEHSLPALVDEAIGLMREDYATLYGVEELSEAMGVSKCHLIRIFSAAVGVSPGQYLTSVRLSAAKELLLSGEYALETVAGLCGFSGANYFCRVFRRAEGCTPTQWRKRELPNRRPRHVPVVL